jgi:transposase InsO family protein
LACAVKEATTETATQLLYEQIVVNYGVPEEILSDRGRNFLARELKGYIDLLSIKHLKTSAYHPRTNGKIENYNGLLGRMLARCVKGARHKCNRYLSEALFNTCIRTHTTTGFSPFYLLYGVQPRIPISALVWTRLQQ